MTNKYVFMPDNQIYYVNGDKVCWTDLDAPGSEYSSCITLKEFEITFTEPNAVKLGFFALYAESIEEALQQHRLLN